MVTAANPGIDPTGARNARPGRPGATLFDAFEKALANTPDKTLVVAGEKRWSYREVGERVEALAANLAALGIGHGDAISLQLPNWAEFMVIHLAATRLGAITNPLLPIYRAKELGYILGFAKTKMVFIPGEFRRFDYPEMYRELAKSLPDLRHVCVVGGGCPDDMTDFETLLRAESAPPAPRRQFDGGDVSALIFTSGTESNPKGVLHSHDTMMFGNHAVTQSLGLTSEEIIWAASPIGHATGLEWSVRLSVFLGATVVMQEVWDVPTAIDLIERERCTFTTAATPFAAMLAEEPGVTERDLSSFRIFLCGGAAIPSTLGATMRERVGCTLMPLWGMSECFIATLCGVDDTPEHLFGTDGRAMPGTEMAIFDATRTRRLPPGEEGEIATRGPHVCLGYFNDPVRTAETFSPEGWLFSNDLGTMDQDGYIRVVGRIKDIINRGGLKISAGEVEDLLIRHPGVKAVALVGVPDVKLGEKSCACVVPKPGAAVSLGDLVGMLKKLGVSSYKLPEFIALIDELPMTPTGKVQKFKLRDDLVSGALPMATV